ncbi:uncharacterized protein LOC133308173 [Gastrolobium bilobum]|uniref:uncharacterized protein LOC133308173 n=1 Tax=Gastrolobium bilobum TaxID=150636 RepID=UPI002AB2D0F7|nr:uncharacterized protein LOC133308173 [Gastrolobium bilobum]
MGKDKQKSIDVFFKKKVASDGATSDAPANIISESDAPSHEQPPSKCHRIEHAEEIIIVKNKSFERDPGKCKPIWEYSANEVDEIRRAYLIAGPYQPQCSYPFSKEKHPRRFQASWFKELSSWLEYSPYVDAAFCLPCYLFSKKVGGRHGWDAFTIKGFNSWHRVHSGKYCAFLSHMGDDPCSQHTNALISCVDLMNQSCHIDKVMHAQSSQQIEQNRLRVKTSIDMQNICGQGYDGASNMRGEWNGLQALFLKECPCAYYVHCFAHRLQLALVAASKEVSSIYQFFQNLNFIITIITASSKRHDQFQAAQISEFEHLQAIGELETGTVFNVGIMNHVQYLKKFVLKAQIILKEEMLLQLIR